MARTVDETTAVGEGAKVVESDTRRETEQLVRDKRESTTTLVEHPEVTLAMRQVMQESGEAQNIVLPTNFLEKFDDIASLSPKALRGRLRVFREWIVAKKISHVRKTEYGPRTVWTNLAFQVLIKMVEGKLNSSSSASDKTTEGAETSSTPKQEAEGSSEAILSNLVDFDKVVLHFQSMKADPNQKIAYQGYVKLLTRLSETPAENLETKDRAVLERYYKNWQPTHFSRLLVLLEAHSSEEPEPVPAPTSTERPVLHLTIDELGWNGDMVRKMKKPFRLEMVIERLLAEVKDEESLEAAKNTLEDFHTSNAKPAIFDGWENDDFVYCSEALEERSATRMASDKARSASREAFAQTTAPVDEEKINLQAQENFELIRLEGHLKKHYLKPSDLPYLQARLEKIKGIFQGETNEEEINKRAETLFKRQETKSDIFAQFSEIKNKIDYEEKIRQLRENPPAVLSDEEEVDFLIKHIEAEIGSKLKNINLGADREVVMDEIRKTEKITAKFWKLVELAGENIPSFLSVLEYIKAIKDTPEEMLTEGQRDYIKKHYAGWNQTMFGALYEKIKDAVKIQKEGASGQESKASAPTPPKTPPPKPPESPRSSPDAETARKEAMKNSIQNDLNISRDRQRERVLDALEINEIQTNFSKLINESGLENIDKNRFHEQLKIMLKVAEWKMNTYEAFLSLRDDRFEKDLNELGKRKENYPFIPKPPDGIHSLDYDSIYKALVKIKEQRDERKAREAVEKGPYKELISLLKGEPVEVIEGEPVIWEELLIKTIKNLDFKLNGDAYLSEKQSQVRGEFDSIIADTSTREVKKERLKKYLNDNIHDNHTDAELLNAWVTAITKT